MICYNLKHSNSRLNGKRWGVETALKRPYIPDKSPLLLTIKSIISQQVHTYTNYSKCNKIHFSKL